MTSWEEEAWKRTSASGDAGQEKEEQAEENLQATVSLVIVLVLVACSIGFELIKDRIEHVATKRFQHVVDKLFGEMTVLGFLSLCTFCAVQSGSFSKLSLALFGDEEELQEKFEFIHFALFFVMIIYVSTVTILIGQAKIIEEEWIALCQLCHEPGVATRVHRQSLHHPSWWWMRMYRFFCPNGASRETYLLYHGLRQEFMLERQLEPPFDPRPVKERVPSTFNFSMYLSRSLEKQLEHIVDIEMETWLFFALFSVAFYGFDMTVQHDEGITAWAWIVIEWLALVFCCFFHHHLCDVKRAMGGKNFDFEFKVVPEFVSNSDDDETEESESSRLLNDSNGFLPDWCKVVLDQQAKKHRQNRQQMLLWFREHGPRAYLILLQINLVFTGVYWTMLFLVHYPYMLQHEPTPVCVAYVILSVLPLLLWREVARNLVGSITQVCSIGHLRKHEAVARVIRDQKVEAMIRAFLALYKVLHAVEMLAKQGDETQNNHNNQSSSFGSLHSSTDSLSSLVKSTHSVSSLGALARNEVERTFDALDVSRDGVLHSSDMQAVLGKLGMSTTPEMTAKIVHALDVDGDGDISKEEFIAFYEHCVVSDDRMSTPKEKARLLFSIFDVDGDGEITQSEFKDTLEAFHFGFSLEDIGALLRELDEDGDGSISENEFKELVEKYFPKEHIHIKSSQSSSRLKRISSWV